MQNDPIPYLPINCSSHDILLAKATLKTNCKISYTNEDGNILQTEAVIIDVYTKTKEEFLQLNNGITIRLDKLIMVDDEQIDKSCSI
jgi:Rho-binding antiterminator